MPIFDYSFFRTVTLILQIQDHELINSFSNLFPESTELENKEGCAGYECLKEYVDKPDPNYSRYDTGKRLHGVETTTLVEWTGYVLDMTSQQWLTPDDSSRSIRWHIMTIATCGFHSTKIVRLDTLVVV